MPTILCPVAAAGRRGRFDVTRWTQMSKGGHFGAVEAPQALAEEVRAFFRPLR